MKKGVTYSPEHTVIPLSGANQAVIATLNPSGSGVQLWRPDVVALQPNTQQEVTLLYQQFLSPPTAAKRL